MRTKTTSKILSETSEETKQKVRNNANNLINKKMKNTVYNEEEVLEIIQKFHSEYGIQFSNESMELFNKLKKTKKMTTQEKATELVQDLGVENAIYVTEEVIAILEDWEGTELSQKDWVEIQKHINKRKEQFNLLKFISDCREKVDTEVPFGKEDAYDAIINEIDKYLALISKTDMIDFLKSVFQQEGFDYKKAYQDWQATKIQ